MINPFLKTIVALAVLAFSASVYAVPIIGGISWSSDGTTVSWDTTANTVDFTPDTPNAEVDDLSGDFTNYFLIGDAGTFSDFNYGSGGFTLWNATGSLNPAALSFNVTTVNIVAETSTILALEGTGLLTDGVTYRDGLWNFTANSLGGTFSWSSSQSVPEPTSLALLGVSLLLIGLSRRRARGNA